MIEGQPRSATAVALEEGTTLEKCTWETLGTFFRERPAKVVVIMQQMGKRIRQLTEDYIGACRTIGELTETSKQKTQEEKNRVDHNLRRYLDAYRAYQGSDNPGRGREL